MTRLLIVSPLRNEEEHLEGLARGVLAQTRRPDEWIVVDDGSTDRTPEILDRLESEIPFLRVVRTPDGYTAEGPDRHAVAASARAFNFGLHRAEMAADFTHIGKLDGDIELPPDYYQAVLERMADNRSLGVAGGICVENRGDAQVELVTPREHVHGALRVWSAECFKAIEGVKEHLGWDGADLVRARMAGFETHSFREIVTVHHRTWGSADGQLRGYMRFGTASWILGHPPLWVLLRAGKTARRRPIGIAGVAFLAGYLRGVIRRVPRAGDASYRRFMRRELYGRLAPRAGRRESSGSRA